MKKMVAFVIPFLMLFYLSVPVCAVGVGSAPTSFTMYCPFVYSSGNVIVDKEYSLSDGSSSSSSVLSVSHINNNVTTDLVSSYVLPLNTWNGGSDISFVGYDAGSFTFWFHVSPGIVASNTSSYGSCSVTVYQVSVSFYGEEYIIPCTTTTSATASAVGVVNFSLPHTSCLFSNYTAVLKVYSKVSVASYGPNTNTSGNSYYSTNVRYAITHQVSAGSGSQIMAYYRYSSSDTNAIQEQTASINSNVSSQAAGINNKIAQETQRQTAEVTSGYDSSGMESTNSSLSSSLTDYDEKENQITDQSVGYIDGAAFISPSSNATLLTSISFTASWLQSLFVALGDWSLLVTISLSLALGLMLIGWFRFRR